MLVRSAARPTWLPTATRAALLLARRPFVNGVASSRTPCGMAALEVRDSEPVVEALAEAYVSMDLTTMSTFHQKAMTQMLAGSSKVPLTSAQVEEKLLQTMGAGGGGGGRAVAATTAAPSATAISLAADSAAAAAASAATMAPEKTAFDITLKKFPAESKIKLIKELRSVCSLAIQEAKSAIERCPGVIARQVQKEDAEKLKAAMVKLGAEVELA